MTLFIFTDGGARGNPGPAGIGVVVKDEKGTVIKKIGKRIGETTNNVAEYSAVIEALTWLIENKSNFQFSIFNFQFLLDSSLVVNQLNGLFKIKDSNLRNLVIKVRALENSLGGNISYKHIPREQNGLADEMVNKALDGLI
ncbi:MAG: Ribonuclease H [Candidatus Gottesmanbacteria bacterium GW2011_GWC2_39_8]|uniref:Ribonuclease H n=1 Tax=Candidatus Gottesmanbacteria bacterium GW2011_GWC2_39_8 TaxID=1618450 RepID=A0A0G0SHB8_9BACT|nr:MAG: Ribonuclease H [Candidatus Gottesmanbacteria bacterium GW2011_GWC2_39_8]